MAATFKNGVMEVPFRNITVGALKRFATEQGVSMMMDSDRNCFVITLHPATVPVVANS